MSWGEDNRWEQNWWGNCVNTTREELLQFSYAKRIGLEIYYDGRSDFNIDCRGRSVIDFGGGPVSLLLKCSNAGVRTVVDPCLFPMWVGMRYGAAGINYLQVKAEEYDGGPIKPYDEAWIYNVLQHTEDPERIVKNALATAHTLRIFEYIDTGTSAGHPHELTARKLNDWIGDQGIVEEIDETGDSAFNKHGASGRCYYGVFSK